MKSFDVCGAADYVGGPFDFEHVRQHAGVYHIRPSHMSGPPRGSAAAIVTTASGTYFVNSGYVGEPEPEHYGDKKMFWLADIPVPATVEP